MESGYGGGVIRPKDEDGDTLSALIGTIYDAALDPAQWRVALGGARDYVGGHSAAIYEKTLTGISGGVFFDDGMVSDEAKLSYFTHYAPLDPATAGHLFAELEQPISTADILDFDEFRQSRFYREWAMPQGIVDLLSAPIDRRGGASAVLFGVFRHERHGVVDGRMRERMRQIVPHIRRAVLIGAVIEAGQAKATSLGDALDGLSAGLFLVDATGRVLHANQAGLQMIESGDAVVARHGRLATPDSAAAETLKDAVALSGAGDSAVGGKGVSIGIESREGERFAAHVLPLAGARRDGVTRYAAAAAVFVHRAQLHAPAAPELVARTFGLTLSELRVFMTIVQADGVAETAEALGIAEATVKSHLQRVFSKTGTSRQADLVKLLAGFAGPLAR
ncbi:MAG: LuxR family transcriptional regulator [Hyphomicrobiales bacterium]|nr:MAG: LuxR family transcriptional regulator [Hyphomicrobiales bacterium]